MNAARAFLLAGLGAAVVLVACAPAAWVGAALPAPLALRDAGGTLWAGRGTLFLGEHFCAASWRVRPGLSLASRIDLEFGAPCAGRAQLVIAPQDIRAQAVNLRVPAQVLAQFSPLVKSWSPRGLLMISADEIFLMPKRSGALNVTWSNAGAGSLPQVSRVGAHLGAHLGDYVAQASLAGETMNARIHTRAGPLHLEGDVTLGTPLRADLLAKSDDAQIESWLKTLGLATGDGRYRLRAQ